MGSSAGEHGVNEGPLVDGMEGDKMLQARWRTAAFKGGRMTEACEETGSLIMEEEEGVSVASMGGLDGEGRDPEAERIRAPGDGRREGLKAGEFGEGGLASIGGGRAAATRRGGAQRRGVAEGMADGDGRDKDLQDNDNSDSEDSNDAKRRHKMISWKAWRQPDSNNGPVDTAAGGGTLSVVHADLKSQIVRELPSDGSTSTDVHEKVQRGAPGWAPKAHNLPGDDSKHGGNSVEEEHGGDEGMAGESNSGNRTKSNQGQGRRSVTTGTRLVRKRSRSPSPSLRSGQQAKRAAPRCHHGPQFNIGPHHPVDREMRDVHHPSFPFPVRRRPQLPLDIHRNSFCQDPPSRCRPTPPFIPRRAGCGPRGVPPRLVSSPPAKAFGHRLSCGRGIARPFPPGYGPLEQAPPTPLRVPRDPRRARTGERAPLHLVCMGPNRKPPGRSTCFGPPRARQGMDPREELQDVGRRIPSTEPRDFNDLPPRGRRGWPLPKPIFSPLPENDSVRRCSPLPRMRVQRMLPRAAQDTAWDCSRFKRYPCLLAPVPFPRARVSPREALQDEFRGPPRAIRGPIVVESLAHGRRSVPDRDLSMVVKTSERQKWGIASREARGRRDVRGRRDTGNVRDVDLRQVRDIRDAQDVGNAWGVRDGCDAEDARVTRDGSDIRDGRGTREVKGMQGVHDAYHWGQPQPRLESPQGPCRGSPVHDYHQPNPPPVYHKRATHLLDRSSSSARHRDCHSPAEPEQELKPRRTDSPSGWRVPGTVLNNSESDCTWFYVDPKGGTQGPCTIEQLRTWLKNLAEDPQYEEEHKQFMSVSVWKQGMQYRYPILTLLEKNCPPSSVGTGRSRVGE